MQDDPDNLDGLGDWVSGLVALRDPTFWNAIAAMFRLPGIGLLWLVGSTEDNTEGCLAPLVGMIFWSSLLIGYCAWLFYG